MKRRHVESSNIRSIGYEDNTLEVEFSGGGIYQYNDVPEDVFNQFNMSMSKGRYLSAYIKGKYNFIKVG